MRTWTQDLLLLFVVLFGRAALGDEPKNPVLVKLAPNQWVKVHEPQPGEMTFRRQPHGGSCFDSKRGRLILFGSDSHGRDFTNIPLFFSTANLKWSRAYENDPRETYRVTEDGLAVAGERGDHPWAMHSFGAVIYDTSRDEMLVTIFDDHLVPGRFTDVFKDLWPQIKRKPTWIYGCDNAEWTALPGNGVNCFPYCAAYDSDRKVVVAVRPDGIHELAGTPRTWRKVVDHGFFGWHTNCAYDAKHKAVVVFGSNETPMTTGSFNSKHWSANVCVNPKTGTYVAILNVWGNFYEKQKAYRSMDGITWIELDSEHFKGGHPIGRIILARMSRDAVVK